MILASEDLVWVTTDDEPWLPFDARQLVDSVCAAAAGGADEPSQLMAESIARAIQQFACEHAP